MMLVAPKGEQESLRVDGRSTLFIGWLNASNAIKDSSERRLGGSLLGMCTMTAWTILYRDLRERSGLVTY
jgi:hypothetical protein